MGLTANTGDNLGGLAQLWITRPDTIRTYFIKNRLTLTKAQLQVLFDQLPFKVGNAYPQRGNAQNVHGTFRELKIMVQLDKQAPEKDALLESYEGREVVAIGLDHHGAYHLFGQLENPLTFVSDLDYGNQPADGQKYTLNLTGTNLPLKTPSVVIL